MATPATWRNVWLGVAVAGVAALVAAWQMRDGPVSNLPVGLMAGGGFGVIFGLIFAGIRHAEVRLRRRMAAGEDVIARWRVDPDTWQRFVEVESGLRSAPGMPPGEMRLPGGAVPATGVEVIVGRGAVQVGDAVHVVPERGSPEVTSAVLDDRRLKLSFVELRLTHHSVDPPSLDTVLRFPVADGSLRAARQVVAHFARETPGRPDFFHGTGDGSDSEDLSRCWSCGFETHKFRSSCERCGEPLQSRRWARRYGAILTLLGGALAAGMVVLLKIIGPALRHAGTGGMRFDGTPAQAKAILLVLGLVFAFGAVTFAYGLFQMVTGRRSRVGVQLILGLAAAMFVTAWLVAR